MKKIVPQTFVQPGLKLDNYFKLFFFMKNTNWITCNTHCLSFSKIGIIFNKSKLTSRTSIIFSWEFVLLLQDMVPTTYAYFQNKNKSYRRSLQTCLYYVTRNKNKKTRKYKCDRSWQEWKYWAERVQTGFPHWMKQAPKWHCPGNIELSNDHLSYCKNNIMWTMFYVKKIKN